MNPPANKWGSSVTTALLALPILYVLSIGPVIYAYNANGNTLGPRTDVACEIFYTPLVWLYENTPLRIPLDWYFELWVP